MAKKTNKKILFALMKKLGKQGDNVRSGHSYKIGGYNIYIEEAGALGIEGIIDNQEFSYSFLTGEFKEY